MSYGLIEQVCAAARTGAISEVALNRFRQSGSLNRLAEFLDEGLISEAEILELIEGLDVPKWALSPEQELAAKILGKNFVSPAALCRALRLRLRPRFTDDELKELAQIPFSEEVLREEVEVTKGNVLLFPTHPKITLPFLREVFGTDPASQPCVFDNDWWLKEAGDPFRDRNLGLGWRLVRTRFEPDSTDQTWHDQEKLVPDTHARTTALAAALAALLI